MTVKTKTIKNSKQKWEILAEHHMLVVYWKLCFKDKKFHCLRSVI